MITLDTGGLVDEYFAAAKLYTASKRQIEVWGECRSACTIMLEVPTLCVGPGAVFRWHHAYLPKTGVIKPEVTEAMLARLPWRIANRLRGKISRDYTPQASLDYNELVSLGVPACKPMRAVPYKPAARSLADKPAPLPPVPKPSADPLSWHVARSQSLGMRPVP